MKSETGREKYRLSVITIIGICIVSLLVLFILTAFSEAQGFFPGNAISGIIADSFVKKYGEDNPQRKSIEFDREKGAYVCEYTCDKGTFYLKVDDFTVTEDGYFESFLEDTEAEKKITEYLGAELRAEWPDNGTSFKECKLNIQIPKGQFGEDEEAGEMLKSILSGCEIEISMSGANVSFDEYKTFVWNLVDLLQKKNFKSEKVQVFYYRNPGEGEAEQVAQYESGLKRYMLDYDEKLIKNSGDTHFVIEVPEDQAKKYMAYKVIRIIYTSVICLTLGVLLPLWFVRYEKKRYRRMKSTDKNR